MTDTFGAICNLLEENLGIETGDATPDTTFDELGVDSLDLIELASDLQAMVGKPLGRPKNITTIGELVNFIDAA